MRYLIQVMSKKKFLVLVLVLSFSLYKTNAQATEPTDTTFSLNFDDGFNNTVIELRDSSFRKILYSGVLSSDKVLGFAKYFILKKPRKYYVKLRMQKYLIDTSKGRYAYVNFKNNKLSIRYSDKKKLYE